MMTLAAGERLGPYEILGPLGAGGMGEVWKARDTRLDRTVAIKVAKGEFGERFEREARAVAALNHPHICQLYDVGPNYLVMEYVEGATLKGPLALDKVVEYAGQILDALEAAHKKRIVHRDLKPANILLTKQGVKLLDFGLAKLGAPLAETDVTRTEALTGKGQVLGTLQYMAPEQLQGQEADARSDLFAFGCVLYELLSGKRAFGGQSPASVIAAILEREPEPLSIGAPLGRVVRTCLEKDPEKRFQTAVDLKRNLLWAVQQSEAAEAPRKWGWGAKLGWGVAVCAILAAGVIWVKKPQRSGGGLPGGKLTRITRDGRSVEPAISPDGKLLAYSSWRDGTVDLYVQQLNGKGVVRLTNDAALDSNPVFSGDGSKIYFQSTREPQGIYEVPALGGDIRLYWEDAQAGAVSPDGKWMAALRRGDLLIRPTVGGEARLLLAQLGDGRPTWSPDGKRLLVSKRKSLADSASEFAVIAVDGGAIQTLPLVENLRRRGMFDAFWLTVLGWDERDQIYFTAPFGDAVNVWKVAVAEAGTAKPQAVTLSNSSTGIRGDLKAGKLAYVNNHSVTSLWKLDADLDRGEITGGLRQLSFDQTNAFHQDLSPDGRYVAYCTKREGSQGIRLLDLLSGKERMVLEAEKERDGFAHLKFDASGQRLLATLTRYESNGEALPVQRGMVDLVRNEWKAQSEGVLRYRAWTPDGKLAVGWRGGANSEIVVADLSNGKDSVILSKSGVPYSEPRLSRDGRWLVFRVGTELRVSAFRGKEAIPEAEQQIVAERGGFPVWSPNGKFLYYVQAGDAQSLGTRQGRLMRQAMDPQSGKPVGAPFQIHDFEKRYLNIPIVNQLAGGPGGFVVGLFQPESDIWTTDVEP